MEGVRRGLPNAVRHHGEEEEEEEVPLFMSALLCIVPIGNYSLCVLNSGTILYKLI
jgi:hypothetical protein